MQQYQFSSESNLELLIYNYNHCPPLYLVSRYPVTGMQQDRGKGSSHGCLEHLPNCLNNFVSSIMVFVLK